MVASNLPTYQKAVNQISMKYNSPVRQARVKNYLHSLCLNSMTANGIEISKALARIYGLILKLSNHGAMSHSGDADKIQFLRAAVVACDWTRESLPRAAFQQRTFQQLYGELGYELRKKAKLGRMPNEAISPAGSTGDRIADLSFDGQPQQRRKKPWKRSLSNNNSKSSLEIQGCFSYDSPSHLAKQCSRLLNVARPPQEGWRATIKIRKMPLYTLSRLTYAISSRKMTMNY